MDAHTPHKALLALHRLVDAGIDPLITPMGLDFATESIVRVDAADLYDLCAGSDPNAALLQITPGPDVPALLIAEPSLSNTVLTRIWRTQRNSTAPHTQVETAILQQFLSDVCNQWRSAWRSAGVDSLPALTMVTTLSMLAPQMPSGGWYVARTVVLQGNDAVGVLLFCYPETLLPLLVQLRVSISWRHRIERGLRADERELLAERVRQLKDLVMPAPVTHRTDVPLRLLNQLEAGDVISLDTPVGGGMRLSVLDREVDARLARRGDHLALAVTGSLGAAPADPFVDTTAYDEQAADHFALPTNHDDGLYVPDTH